MDANGVPTGSVTSKKVSVKTKKAGGKSMKDGKSDAMSLRSLEMPMSEKPH